MAASARKRNENKNKKKKEKSKSEINSRSLWRKRKQKCISRCSIRISLLSFFFLVWHFFRRCVIWCTYTPVLCRLHGTHTINVFHFYCYHYFTLFCCYFCRVSLFFFTSCRVLRLLLFRRSAFGCLFSHISLVFLPVLLSHIICFSQC